MQTMFLACATHGPTQEIGQGTSKKLGTTARLVAILPLTGRFTNHVNEKADPMESAFSMYEVQSLLNDQALG